MFWSITDWLDIIEEKEGGGRSVIWIQMGDINNQRIAAQKADGGGRDHLFLDLGVVSKESFIWDTDWDKYYVILRQSAADLLINWVIVAHEEESPTYEVMMMMMMMSRRRRRIVPNMKRDQITSLLATILPTGSSTRQHINRSFPEIQHSSHFTSVENDLSGGCSLMSLAIILSIRTSEVGHFCLNNLKILSRI